MVGFTREGGYLDAPAVFGASDSITIFCEALLIRVPSSLYGCAFDYGRKPNSLNRGGVSKSSPTVEESLDDVVANALKRHLTPSSDM